MTSTPAPKFTVGQRVRVGSASPTRIVVLAKPDLYGRIVVETDDGEYLTNPQDTYEPIPARFTVELRPPKAGERYLRSDTVDTAQFDADNVLPVIVDEDGA